jgi:SAM-dependent methyltransferase
VGRGSGKRKGRRALRKRPRLERDRHWLYEQAVQCPEADVQFFDRVFRKRHQRVPTSLREDFCGTAALCAEWVRTRPENTAIGIDLDPSTLEWGRVHNVEPLGSRARRVQLIEADVLSVRRPQVDLIAAMNFSYFTFKTRDLLRDYFRRSRSVLADGGALFLDIFGGWEGQALVQEEKEFDGFNYYWDQHSFDPISNETIFYIHFVLDDGKELQRAFKYDWRMWSIPEVRELLAEAGFESSKVYWEGTDSDGDGNGVFRVAKHAESCPGWIAYIVAWK